MKTSEKYTFRMVALEDAAKLLEIYTPFVISEDRSISDVSFEYEAPSLEEFTNRIKTISAAYPYLVCCYEGEPVGYAYAHPYIQREAYQWGAEVTIYLAPVAQGKGLGRVLYEALEELLAAQGIINLYSCITASNEHSVMMHKAMGYKIVGTFNNSGFKHGHWLDMVWMEKVLGLYPKEPKLIKKVGDLEEEIIRAVLDKANGC